MSTSAATRSRSRASGRRMSAARRRTVRRRRIIALLVVAAVAALGAIALLPNAEKAVQELALPLRHEDIIRQQSRRQGPGPLARRGHHLRGVALPRRDVARRRARAHADHSRDRGLHRPEVRRHEVRAGRPRPRRRSTSPTAPGTCATCWTATTATRSSRFARTTAARATSTSGCRRRTSPTPRSRCSACRSPRRASTSSACSTPARTTAGSTGRNSASRASPRRPPRRPPAATRRAFRRPRGSRSSRTGRARWGRRSPGPRPRPRCAGRSASPAPAGEQHGGAPARPGRHRRGLRESAGVERARRSERRAGARVLASTTFGCAPGPFAFHATSGCALGPYATCGTP